MRHELTLRWANACSSSKESRRLACRRKDFSRSVFSRSMRRGEDLDHALGRFGFELGRGVASEDGDRNAAFSGLREDIGRQVIGNPIDAFCHGIRRCRRQHRRVVDTIMKYPHGRQACRRVAEDARGLRQAQILLVHAQHFPRGLADEQIHILERTDRGEALLEEMPGPCERPSAV